MEFGPDFALLPVAKPRGITSTEVLNRLKRKFGLKKVGHTGTLDPFAEGLLLLLLGRATRLAEYYQKLPKTYRAVGLLGVETDTYDATGEVLFRKELESPPSAGQLEKVLTEFVGTFEQQPPPFSAKKVGGKRAYRLARAGKKVELKPVKVTVYDLKLVSYEPPRFEVETTVSGGTYVRSLIRDIGRRLGTGATTERLIRTAVGKITLDGVPTLERLLDEPSLDPFLRPPWDGLDLPVLKVGESDALKLRNGQLLEVSPPAEDLFLIFTEGGRFVGIGKNLGGKVKPEKVFI
ncbi:MAG: tRNA pseudouridine(55) synthase TruB [Aquificae bacterium]|nr:tRNA pseudouridine(55) synthase TruB [Aquificota bacterium]